MSCTYTLKIAVQQVKMHFSFSRASTGARDCNANCGSVLQDVSGCTQALTLTLAVRVVYTGLARYHPTTHSCSLEISNPFVNVPSSLSLAIGTVTEYNSLRDKR
jgi:hypothetical protein